MPVRRWNGLLALLLLAGCSDDLVSGDHLEPSQRNERLRVLFIGNSHTFTHDVPEMVGRLAASMGDTLTYLMSAPGGFDFERHRALPQTLGLIQALPWDYVVLQESGWRVALPPPTIDSMVYAPARDLAGLIRLARPQAGLVLYMTHGYARGVNNFDPSWCAQDADVCTYDGMQTRIRETYRRLAEEIDAQVAPAGVVWRILMGGKRSLVLHGEDGVHANVTGSYVSACVLYGTLFRNRLEGAYHPSGVSAADAALIQATVSEVLFEGVPDWRVR